VLFMATRGGGGPRSRHYKTERAGGLVAEPPVAAAVRQRCLCINA
jgi:hypothetical protein